MELKWFTREEKVQDFDSFEQNPNSQFSIDSVSTNTSLRALDTQILFALRWWGFSHRPSQNPTVQSTDESCLKYKDKYKYMQTMLNLWWIIKHSIPQIEAESTPDARFRFWSCEGKKFEAFDELKHTNSFEDCSDRPQIMWITSTFYACYNERYDVE